MHQVTEISVDGRDLYAAVDLANSVIPSRTPMESLKNLLIQVSDGFMTISAGDSATSVRATVSADSVRPADFAILAATFKQVLSDCDGKITIGITDRQANITTSNGKFNLPLSNLEGMVPAIGFDSLDYVTADLAKFRFALAGASRCVSEVKGGDVFSNVLIDPKVGHVAGADSRRIMLAFVPWEKTGDPYLPDSTNRGENQILLSVSACSVLQRLSGSSIDATFSANSATFRSGTVVVNCKLSVGRYPLLTKFTTPANGAMVSNCEVISGAFASIVNRVRVVTTEESRAVMLEFSPESITASTQSANLGEAESSVPIQLKGPAVSVYVDSRYLAEFLSRVDKAAAMRVGLKDFQSHVFMDVESLGLRYVAMPIVLEQK